MSGGAVKKKQSTILAAGGGLLLLLILLRFWSSAKKRGEQYATEDATIPKRLLAWMRRRQLLQQRRPEEYYDTGSSDSSKSKDFESPSNGEQSPPAATGTNGCWNDRGGAEMGRIRENQRLIRSVLAFWFGRHGGPKDAQKKLWMISQQNVELRGTVDAQIGTQFGALLCQLAHPKADPRWKEWCEDSEMYGYQGKLAAIIVLDQFSRHIHRWLLESAGRVGVVDQALQLQLRENLPEQSVLDALAHRTAVLLTDRHEIELQTGMTMSTPMRIFALFPFRHAATVETVQWTQAQTEQLAANHDQCDAMIKAFRKATNRRLAVLQDEARRTGSSIKRDEPASLFQDDDILECVSFPADLTLAADHVVHQTIRDFLAAQGIREAKEEGATHHQAQVRRPIVVSLSGGVDSMVIAAVLAHLQQQCGYLLRVVAVHIDYANRPESAAEAAYVERYCRDLEIEYRCRRIDEVTRGITARDDYERVAREIRYAFYRETVAACLNEDWTAVHQVGVVLGHHRGDLRENVLSNAHKGCGPLDLSGMTATSFNDGVTLYRPLLPLEKTAIFDYAHTFGIPYFKDTTPHWSTRGKLRNKLLPLLEEIYGEGCMNNLSNLAVESDECRALLHSVMIQPFMNLIAYKPMGISFPTAPWKEQGPFFWKFVLREALHSAGLGMFTDKSVEQSFMKRACATKLHEGWLQCRKDYGVYLRADGQIFILYPGSFPWLKKEYYNCTGQTVAYGSENAAKIGPWRVTAEVYSEVNSLFQPDDEIASIVERKAFTSMEAFMEGSYEYYLRVPSWKVDGVQVEPRPLVFTKFVKRSRPRAWKGIDPKIQDALPLLGNDEEAMKALGDPVGCGTVHIDNNKNIATPVFCVKVALRLTDVASTSFQRQTK